MKIDLYTKLILTVIAGALILLCAQNFALPRVVSAQGEQHVVIDGWSYGNINRVMRIDSNPLPVSVAK
jgi:hypothetical protein